MFVVNIGGTRLEALELKGTTHAHAPWVRMHNISTWHGAKCF